MPAVFWIVIAAVFLIALFVKPRENPPGFGSAKKAPVRIDHPHYYDEDDHECSVCGARFTGKGMTCPRCGARFTGTREDDDEYIDEMVFWEDDDEQG